jgi:uncharacterized protein
MKKIIFLLIMPFFFVKAQTEFPTLNQFATDFTSTLSSSELNTLNSALKSFQDSTSNQVIFLMVSSLNDYPLESYTYEVAAKNKIGTAKNNNGILFFIAKDDRKMRIEVGYGLEGALPDALTSSILRNEVKPYFKHGDYYSGIAAGLNAIMKASIGEYKNENRKDEEEEGGKFPFGVIIAIIIFIIVSSRGGKGKGGGILPWLIIGSMSGGSRRSGGFGDGGGSGFGGGFGGFSGGGGSFGGGGSSGSW